MENFKHLKKFNNYNESSINENNTEPMDSDERESIKEIFDDNCEWFVRNLKYWNKQKVAKNLSSIHDDIGDWLESFIRDNDIDKDSLY